MPTAVRAERGCGPRAGASEQQLATLRFGLAYERAVLGWFDELGCD